jgi:hypothetical protein
MHARPPIHALQPKPWPCSAVYDYPTPDPRPATQTPALQAAVYDYRKSDRDASGKAISKDYECCPTFTFDTSTLEFVGDNFGGLNSSAPRSASPPPRAVVPARSPPSPVAVVARSPPPRAVAQSPSPRVVVQSPPPPQVVRSPPPPPAIAAKKPKTPPPPPPPRPPRAKDPRLAPKRWVLLPLRLGVGACRVVPAESHIFSCGVVHARSAAGPAAHGRPTTTTHLALCVRRRGPPPPLPPFFPFN